MRCNGMHVNLDVNKSSGNMDEYVVRWLKEWQLEDLVDRFREEEVDERAFRNLPDEIIRELIPKLGRRAIFLANYARYKENLQKPPNDCEPEIDSLENDTDTTSGPAYSFSSPPQLVPFSIEEISCITREDQEAKERLLQLLERTPSAVHLIKKEFFTRKDRDLLSHVVIQHLWPECCAGVLPQDTLLLWSRAVEFLFCHEIASIYCRLDEDGELKGIFIKCITSLKQRVARDQRLGESITS
ncbi:sterile alpha motif domain-containing protein 3-like isoform X2 [Anopheles albimanus]|uniref:sterile alpha motif domain-containing protein 3-like isoform X2 n=1 Tax=Anopheles albimanus TaxID=7167 RepID=UPI001641606A|nr:sterile alpha motif domain-containing protein 3-like isoform X2 [Anopheles albimanus]